MDFNNLLSNFLAKKQTIKELKNRLTPNSWGRQQYEGAYFEPEFHEDVDLKNIDSKRGWIVAYAKKYFEGIKKKKKTSRQTDYSSNYITYKRADVA